MTHSQPLRGALIAGTVLAIDAHGRAWLDGVQLDDKPLCPHMLIGPTQAARVGERLAIKCEFRRGRYVPVAE